MDQNRINYPRAQSRQDEFSRVIILSLQNILDQAQSGNQDILDALGDLALEVTADQINLNTDDLEKGVWTKIPGNSLELIYYAGVEAPSGNFGNPSGTVENVKTLVYKTAGSPVFYQDFAWDSLDRTVLITART
jgi:hypothetical protein